MNSPRARRIGPESIESKLTAWARNNPNDSMTFDDIRTKYDCSIATASKVTTALCELGVLVNVARHFRPGSFNEVKFDSAVATLERLGYVYKGGVKWEAPLVQFTRS